MFSQESSPSPSASYNIRSSIDEKGKQDIEEAKSWIAAQWRLSGIPPLKLREPCYVDTRRWKSNKFERVASSGQHGPPLEKNAKDPDADDDTRSMLNPIRFTLWRKVCICTSIILMTAISLLASSVVSGMTSAIGRDFGVTDDFLQSLYGSMYLLGIAIGVLAVAPLSERYGRLPVYHTSNVGFIVTLLLCSKCTSSTALLASRFASGLCGCSSLVLGGPTIRDIVYAEEKCHNRVLWSLCRLSPLFGYVAAQFGTYIGRTILKTTHWRDVFRYLGIGAIFVGAATAILLRETYAPVLQATVPGEPGWIIKKRNNTIDSSGSQSSFAFLPQNYIPRRDRQLSALSPTVLLLSFYSTIFNCYIFLLYTTLANVFADVYHFSPTTVNLAYLGLGTGMAVGLVYLLFLYPYSALSTRVSHDLESLIWAAIPAAIMMPVAIFLYGWSLHFVLNSIVPVVATGMIGAAFLTTFVPIQIYLIDLFTTRAACALAPSIFLSNVAGTLLPSLAPRVLEALEIEWTSSVLGCTALVLVPFPFLFIRYGRRLREQRLSDLTC